MGYGSEESNHAIELVKLIDPPDQFIRGNTYGHVALLVKIVQEMSNRLKKAGIELAHAPNQTRLGNPNMIAFIKDPDSYKIELTERR